ncbi:MAG: 2-C-methyl-D-erythritol 2,4-cyclodiphosphate synthase [Elusimicrobiota bacterium]
MRTGIGYDIHGLEEGEELILGGVKIDYSKGLVGHSDADVLSHAVADALLGAAGLEDIGKHFPDTAEKYKDISSLKLLKKVKEKIETVNYEVNNIDITLICERPRLDKYTPDMVENIASALEVPDYDINVKVTTNEGFGAVGHKKAISCLSVVTIIPVPGYNKRK